MTSTNRDKRSTGKAKESATSLNPGDQAAPGTPGTGENVCPNCSGSGRIGREPCNRCGGSGKVIEGIGGG